MIWNNNHFNLVKSTFMVCEMEELHRNVKIESTLKYVSFPCSEMNLYS
jgi:hypothetical protein